VSQELISSANEERLRYRDGVPVDRHGTFGEVIGNFGSGSRRDFRRVARFFDLVVHDISRSSVISIRFKRGENSSSQGFSTATFTVQVNRRNACSRTAVIVPRGPTYVHVKFFSLRNSLRFSPR
jgi:hypothetical protein